MCSEIHRLFFFSFDSTFGGPPHAAPSSSSSSAPSLASSLTAPDRRPGSRISLGFFGSSRASAEQIKEEERAMEEMAASLVTDLIPASDLDQIFSDSQRLTNDAVIHFVEAVCRVSLEEMAGSPRVFCLQKIVEISYFNMDRSRLVWRRIWDHQSKHFVKAACHENSHVAMYAIDSLRQLAMKFLEKEELENYQFQKEFLKPFEKIATQNPNRTIRELVLQCVENLVLSKISNIRSGWKPIFGVCAVCANSGDGGVVQLGFRLVSAIMAQFNRVHDFFVDCVHCLIAYIGNQVLDAVSLKAIDFLRLCVIELASGNLRALSSGNPGANATEGGEEEGRLESQPPAPTTATTNGAVSVGVKAMPHMVDGEDNVKNDAFIKLWFPILTGLSGLISGDSRLAVRKGSTELLFHVLLTYGDSFNANFWGLTFRGVLFPLFDDVAYLGDSNLDRWIETTCLDALSSLGELFVCHFNKLAFMLRDLLDLIQNCIMEVSADLSHTAFASLTNLIDKRSSYFTPEIWQQLVTCLENMFAASCPYRVNATNLSILLSKATTQLHNDSDLVPAAPPSDATQTQDQDETNDNGNNNRNKSKEGASEDDHSIHDTPNGFVTGGVGLNANGDVEGEIARVSSHCLVQLDLVSCVGSLCSKFHSAMPAKCSEALLKLLTRSFLYAHAFDQDISLRVGLSRAGVMKQSQTGDLPSLLKLEVSSLMSCLEVSYGMWQSRCESFEIAWRTFLDLSRLVVVSYAAKDALVSSVPLSERDVVCTEKFRELGQWTKVVNYVIQLYSGVPADDLRPHLHTVLPDVVSLVTCSDAPLRANLKPFLTKHVQLLLQGH
eukprot:c18240_g1_i2.p1 GENE.c18240_g1_i2~~c18240_g1_i2.p1  ORF type:complete len:834 (+),score=207.49 c18240_g1_i2:1-2502(+)